MFCIKSNTRKRIKKLTFLTYILTSRRANNHLLKKRDHNLNKNLLFILRALLPSRSNIFVRNLFIQNLLMFNHREKKIVSSTVPLTDDAIA